MFALLWKLPKAPYTAALWTEEAEPGVPYMDMKTPSDGQEARFIATEHHFMRNEWASSRSPDNSNDWKKFVTTAYNNMQS